MSQLKEIRHRIGVVKNTQKITRAMKMVATAKLRRAQDRIISARPYAIKIEELLKQLIASSDKDVNPLMEEREVRSTLLVVISSDRGLCGSFNSNLLKYAEVKLKELGKNTKVIAIGKKSVDFFKRKRILTLESHPNVFGDLKIEFAKSVVNNITKGFKDKIFDRVFIINNEFVSMMRHVPVFEQFLPVVGESENSDETEKNKTNVDYIFEPDADSILNGLIPRQLLIKFWKSLLESNAAEQAARMTAMDMATRNADDLIKFLDLQYNRARQEAITKELLEIVAGAEALKEG